MALGKRLLGGVQPEEALHALVASDTTPNARPDYELRIARVAGTIDGSLFDDGQDAGLSDRLIMELAEIFGWDIDFVLDLRRGDSFVVLYEEKYWRGDKISDGDILAAEFVNQGRVYRAIGFRGDDGRMQYYSPDGFSLKRDFLRTPVKFSRVSSLFSRSRYHPILKTWRAHHGVDYDAPAGTPVRATASGRITAVGWNGGYGNMIAIRHAGPYSTLYAHLARYRAGLRAGQTIEQGEIIGYVGQTGLATAPHLHYEIQVNGVHRDPLTFKLPLSARMPISSDLRQMFRQDAANWIVQLEAGTGGNLVADIDAVISKQQ
ncbi:MAG: peptidoglycan DD-metalloendopeptidase family protein [Gammaproteobacteria bacterium]